MDWRRVDSKEIGFCKDQEGPQGVASKCPGRNGILQSGEYPEQTVLAQWIDRKASLGN